LPSLCSVGPFLPLPFRYGSTLILDANFFSLSDGSRFKVFVGSSSLSFWGHGFQFPLPLFFSEALIIGITFPPLVPCTPLFKTVPPLTFIFLGSSLDGLARDKILHLPLAFYTLPMSSLSPLLCKNRYKGRDKFFWATRTFSLSCSTCFIFGIFPFLSLKDCLTLFIACRPSAIPHVSTQQKSLPSQAWSPESFLFRTACRQHLNPLSSFFRPSSAPLP